MERPVPTTRTRRAKVATHNGETVGTCIYLSSKELGELDINVSESRVLEYRIGRLHGEAVVLITEVDE
jgi:hypothetical protein